MTYVFLHALVFLSYMYPFLKANFQLKTNVYETDIYTSQITPLSVASSMIALPSGWNRGLSLAQALPQICMIAVIKTCNFSVTELVQGEQINHILVNSNLWPMCFYMPLFFWAICIPS